MLERVSPLLEFVRQREVTLKKITAELERLNKDFERSYLSSYSLNQFSVRGYHEEIMKFIEEENGHLKLMKQLHETFINIQNGLLILIYKNIKEEKNVFPEEEQALINEFLVYLRKLVAAFFQLIKIVTRLEKLETREEADFGYLYALLNAPIPKISNPTEIQRLIHKLETEFGT